MFAIRSSWGVVAPLASISMLTVLIALAIVVAVLGIVYLIRRL